jgi:hypothetical protein
MDNFGFYFMSIVIFGSLFYIFYKAGLKIYHYIKIQNFTLLDEKQLAADTKAKFKSLNELEVLKFVMYRTGWTLAKSKAFCDKIKLQTGHVPKDKPNEMPLEPSPTLKNNISKEELEIIVREKIAAIGKLETISYIIKNTGWTLKESKTFCDKIELELNQEIQSTSKKLNKASSTNSKADEDQINFIISKTGWAYDKAKAYFKDIQSYEKDSQKAVVIKKFN